jgi:hypothetical protein
MLPSKPESAETAYKSIPFHLYKRANRNGAPVASEDNSITAIMQQGLNRTGSGCAEYHHRVYLGGGWNCQNRKGSLPGQFSLWRQGGQVKYPLDYIIEEGIMSLSLELHERGGLGVYGMQRIYKDSVSVLPSSLIPADDLFSVCESDGPLMAFD